MHAYVTPGQIPPGDLRTGGLMSETLILPRQESKPVLAAQACGSRKIPRKAPCSSRPSACSRRTASQRSFSNAATRSVTIAEMADEFRQPTYKAPRERILTDIVKLLQTLADKRMLDVAP